MSQLNTSASLFTRPLLDDPSESLLWDRWIGKATTPQSRVFYPQAVPAERLQLFLRFELTLALATADEPSEEWIRKFDKLLEKAYYHFGVQPTASVVKKWLDYDVAQIVGLVAAHPAGRHLHQFSELVQRLAEMQEAFPDPKRLENLKTLLLNIATSVNALPLSSPDHSLDAALADLIGFVGLDGELDEDLREELEERLNSSDMELDSSLLRPAIIIPASRTELAVLTEETQVELSTDRKSGGDHESKRSSSRQQTRARSPRHVHAADRPRPSRPRSEGSGERSHSPLAAQETGASGEGKPSGTKRRSSHASQPGSMFSDSGLPHIKSHETWSAEVQSLKEKLADQTAASEAARQMMTEHMERERDGWARERAGWERERATLTAGWERERESLTAGWKREHELLTTGWKTERELLITGWDKERQVLTTGWEKERQLLATGPERERELLNERVAELKEQVAELKAARQKA